MDSDKHQFRVPYNEMVEILEGILLKLGFEEKDARLIAETHTQSSCDGVESHGLNRFPRFVEYVRAGYVRIGGQMKLLTNWGALERWDGQQRAGILNRSEEHTSELQSRENHVCRL